MDDDGSKALCFEEFHKGIVETGLKCTEDEAKDMFQQFDKDGGGTVNIDEFLMAIRVSIYLFPQVLVFQRKIFQPPMSQTRKNVILEAYKKLDKTGDGTLTVEDLKVKN